VKVLNLAREAQNPVLLACFCQKKHPLMYKNISVLALENANFFGPPRELSCTPLLRHSYFFHSKIMYLKTN
jgi:hypothetical protein